MTPSAPAGAWVEISQTVLTPSQRAAGIPPETAATPLIARVSGFLTEPAALGDTVTIRSIIGREHRGQLNQINPSFCHSFGDTVEEILTIGTEDGS